MTLPPDAPSTGHSGHSALKSVTPMSPASASRHEAVSGSRYCSPAVLAACRCSHDCASMATCQHMRLLTAKKLPQRHTRRELREPLARAMRCCAPHAPPPLVARRARLGADETPHGPRMTGAGYRRRLSSTMSSSSFDSDGSAPLSVLTCSPGILFPCLPSAHLSRRSPAPAKQPQRVHHKTRRLRAR